VVYAARPFVVGMVGQTHDMRTIVTSPSMLWDQIENQSAGGSAPAGSAHEVKLKHAGSL
jgi:hypothetical protein